MNRTGIALLSTGLLLLGMQATRNASAAERERGDRDRAQMRAERQSAGEQRAPEQRPPPSAARPDVTFAPAPREPAAHREQEQHQEREQEQHLEPSHDHDHDYFDRDHAYYGHDHFDHDDYDHDHYHFEPLESGFRPSWPAAGFVISVLPQYYSTRWIGGNEYYYADDVYYTWEPEQNGYAVVDPPVDSAQDDLIVYPKNGQSKERQTADKFACHSWAKTQTGFDPTQPGGGVARGRADRSRSNYNRAMSACLQGRGYQVN